MRRRPRQDKVSRCTGRSERSEPGCRFPPKYVVGDQPACIYHTLAALERGLDGSPFLTNPRVVVGRFS